MKTTTFRFAPVAAVLAAALGPAGPGCGGQTSRVGPDADAATTSNSGSDASGGSTRSSGSNAPTSGSNPSPPTTIPGSGGSDGGHVANDGGVQPCPAYGPGPRETCTRGIQCDTAPDCVCADDGRVTCNFARSCHSTADCQQPETCAFLRDTFSPFGACASTGTCSLQSRTPACSGSSVKGCACDGTDVSVCLSAQFDERPVRHLGPCAESGPHWYPSCPGPVGCARAPSPALDDAGAPCPPIGSPCATLGQTCGGSNGSPNDTCTASEMCVGVPNCPQVMSSAKFKKNIAYVTDNGLEKLHDETMRVRLATYNYKSQFGDPDVRHLGFIIEDNPKGVAVDGTREHVDLYAYVSMVVAAMQVQEREIADLRRQLEEARSVACGHTRSVPLSE